MYAIYSNGWLTDNQFHIKTLYTIEWRTEKRNAPYQFRPPIALRTDLSHITTELWEKPMLRMAH